MPNKYSNSAVTVRHNRPQGQSQKTLKVTCMTNPTENRSQLKAACDRQEWAFLDLLLERDATHINDHAVYTDTWGDWWGLLLECVYQGHADGVRVLLKHG